MPNRIIVTVQDGLVEDVLVSQRLLRTPVFIVDFDTAGMEEENLVPYRLPGAGSLRERWAIVRGEEPDSAETECDATAAVEAFVLGVQGSRRVEFLLAYSDGTWAKRLYSAPADIGGRETDLREWFERDILAKWDSKTRGNIAGFDILDIGQLHATEKKQASSGGVPSIPRHPGDLCRAELERIAEMVQDSLYSKFVDGKFVGWDLDKDVSGCDLVDSLCGLLQELEMAPPEPA